MKNVYLASKTILLFLVIVLIIQTVFGEKPAQNMIVMILFSMLVLNSDSVATYLKTVTDTLTYDDGKTSTHTNESGRTHGGGGKSF